MSYLMDDITYLTKDIGPRPAGTEEERSAAMYIAENISKRSGLNFNIEDFDGAKGSLRALNVAAILSAIVCIVSSILTIITIPAFLVCTLVAVVTVLELLGKPIISGLFRYGVSQNVVAKYEPSYSADKPVTRRKRKVVFVTHYDSSHAFRDDGSFMVSSFYYLRIISAIALCIIPLMLLTKIIAFSEATGAVSLFFLIFSIILSVVTIIPQIQLLIFSRMPYNEAANCNATGTAALMEIARLLGTGAFGVDNTVGREAQPRVHGSEAAAAAGLIPEGAEVNYKADTNVPQAPDGGFLGDTTKYDDALAQKEKALADAKAAVAAFMSPKSRDNFDASSESNKPTIGGGTVVQSQDDGKQESDVVGEIQADAEAIDTTSTNEPVVSQAVPGVIPSYETQANVGEVPSWYKAAQSKAQQKNQGEDEKQTAEPVRSRFAHTMDAMAQRQEERRLEAERIEEEKRAKLRAQIEAANLIANKKEEKEVGQTTPFFRNDEGESSTDELTLDERFKRRQLDNKPLIKASKNEDALKTQEQAPNNQVTQAQTQQEQVQQNQAKPEQVQQMQTQQEPQVQPKQEQVQQVQPQQEQVPQVQPQQEQVPQVQPVVEAQSVSEPQTSDVKKADFNKQDTGKLQAIDTSNNDAKSPTLRPDSSGSLDLESNKQYAPLDDVDFVKTPKAAPAEINQQQTDQQQVGIADVDQPTQAIPLQNIPEINHIAETQDQNSNVSQTEQKDIVQDKPQDTKKEEFAFSQDHEKGKFGTGSFKAVSKKEGTAGATGTFAAIADELVAEGEVDSMQDIVVDDVDDNAFSDNEYTDAGAFAGPGYVEMPDKKRKGFLGLFGKSKNSGKHIGQNVNYDNKQNNDQSQQSELDNNFNPQNEIIEIQDDIADAPVENLKEKSDDKNKNEQANLDNLPKTDWEGGAFSNVGNFFKKDKSDNENQPSGQDFSLQDSNGNPEFNEGAAGDATMQMPPVDSQGGEFNAPSWDNQVSSTSQFGSEPSPAPITSDKNKISSMLDPLPNFDEQIQEFHDGSINLEVWMVALGAEIGENAGMRNFLLEHSADLRGAIIVDVEALGRGEMSLVEGEGLIKRTNVSPRLKRYIRRAANKMGVSIPSLRLPWLGSSASYANTYGFNALKLAGIENNKPSYFMAEADTLDVVDENTLQQNIKFLIKLIQSI